MLAETIVTQGYWYTTLLVMALYLAVKSGFVVPIPLDGRAQIDPLVAFNVERLLATALAVGVFLVAINTVLPTFFPGAGPSFIERLLH